MKKRISGPPKAIFWDIDIAGLNIKSHKSFIIERILEYGNEQAVKWLFRRYPLADIKEVARKSRRLSSKTKNFWKIKLNLWKNQKRSAKKRSEIWSY